MPPGIPAEWDDADGVGGGGAEGSEDEQMDEGVMGLEVRYRMVFGFFSILFQCLGYSYDCLVNLWLFWI